MRAREPDDLTPALRVKVEELRTLLVRMTPRESLERYRIGALIRDVENEPRKYGSAAVAQLARELLVDESTLYKYAAVARTWTESELEQLVMLRGRAGLPLSFAHFVALTTVEERQARDALVEETLARGLTARQLRARINQPARAPSDEEGAPLPFLRSLVTASSRMSAERAAWRERIATLDEREPSAELARLLESALDAQRELERAFAEDAKITEAALKRVRREIVRK
jgi:hypothetical protein